MTPTCSLLLTYVTSTGEKRLEIEEFGKIACLNVKKTNKVIWLGKWAKSRSNCMTTKEIMSLILIKS